MHNAFTDEVTTGDEDARLQDEYAAIQHYLHRMARALARAKRLREITRAVDAARARRLDYSGVEDTDLSRVDALLAQMQVATDEIAAGHELRMADRLLPMPRRLSFKMEEAAMTSVEVAAQDKPAPERDGVEEKLLIEHGRDAMQDALFIIDMDEHDDEPTDREKTAMASATPEEIALRERASTKIARVTKTGVVVNVLDVVTAPPPPMKRSAKIAGSEATQADPLAQHAIECLRQTESLDVREGDKATFACRELLEELAHLAQDADTAHTFARSGKPRGSLSAVLLTAIATAVERALHALLKNEMALDVVQAVLRFQGTIVAIRHPEFKTIFVSPRQILQGIVNGWAETLGGMKRRGVSVSIECDERAFECFALAIDLQTTTDGTKRDKLIDDVLHALKQGFRPTILRSDAVLRSHPVGEERKKRSVVTWAGRVMLLAAHVVAHAIAMHALLQADQFLKITDQICARHALFPQFFERARTKVWKAPFQPRPTAPLNMPREAKRIEGLDTVV